MYLDASNLYGWQCFKNSVNNFKWKTVMSIFDKEFIKNYVEDSDVGYVYEVTINYPKYLHDLHSDLPFLPERMKINKCSKLVCNLYD